ncbi:MAG: hypothetical protein CMB43_04610 [Euryarchaeota archaeon]|nr:hypothetical protein [Euryarchaeota archaeon]
MARVVVVGAGIAGLSAAIHAVSGGHHVVVLEKKAKIGGRGTSQNVDGYSLHYGPHLFDKAGPFFRMCKKLSRVKPVAKSIRLDKTDVIGYGPIRPVGNIKQAAQNKRAIKQKRLANPYFQAVNFLANWGIDYNDYRIKSVVKSRLCASNEGWIGLIGRLGAALDEVGVLIETRCEVKAIDNQQVYLTDGRNFSCDAVILACGANGAKRILHPISSQLVERKFTNLITTFGSCIEVGLSSKPMAGKHCIIDLEQNAALIDYAAIQPMLGNMGSHISAIVTGIEDDRTETQLESLLDRHIAGWKKHIITELRQSRIAVGYSNRIEFDTFGNHKILLAGAWVESDYALSDAAADTGKQAAQGINSIL